MKAHELAEILLKLPADTEVRTWETYGDSNDAWWAPIRGTFYDERNKVVDLSTR